MVVFGICYVAWGISYTINDISYWSMLPSLSQDQREREQIGSVARICASVGLFLVVALIVPITEALGGALGSLQKGYCDCVGNEHCRKCGRREKRKVKT